MGKPYSQDLRERVIATVDAGTRLGDLRSSMKLCAKIQVVTLPHRTLPRRR
jgi:hypothetical protein